MKSCVIGAGYIAKQHLACLIRLPGVEVAGICDLSAAVAEAAAERFGLPRWFTDHREMLDVAKPDVVHVATPFASHFPLAMDALAAGAHLFVEKPITPEYAQLQSLLARAREAGRHVIEDHNYLFNLFSGMAQPDVFSLRVHGTRMRAEAGCTSPA